MQPDTSQTVANIVSVYNAASETEREEGAEWYSAALTFARGLSERYGVDVTAAAGIIAALSPRLPWDRNMLYADTLCATGDAPVLGGSKDKARRIWFGEPPLDVLSGDKVSNFYRCIMGDPDAVVVDRHAFDVAYGSVTDDRTRKALDRVGEYEAYANAYRAAAAILGLSAAVVQATAWVTWRNRLVHTY